MHDIVEDVGRGVPGHFLPLGDIFTIKARTAAVSGKSYGVFVLGNGPEGFSVTVIPLVGASLII